MIPVRRVLSTLAILIVATTVVSGCAEVQPNRAAGVQRVYVFNCGESTVQDISRWTPGVNAGKPGAFSANCYLVQHARGLMVWDSGINDDVAAMPGGFQRGKLSPRYILRKPFRAPLAEIGIDPGKVTHAAFSHTHGDHVGNANLFSAATLYIQQAEHDVAFGPDAATKWNFEVASYDKLRASRTVKLHGDHDVFGDGSVVILSGDMVHLKENWTARRVPSFNYDVEQSRKSMEKIAALMQQTGAELWINHDKAQSDRIPKAPAYVE